MGRGEGDGAGDMTERLCPVCGASLEGRRSDAVTCGPACRRERSRARRLAAGKPDGGYLTLGQWLDRRRRRAQPAGGRY